MTQFLPLGSEAPQLGCLYENGFNLCNWGQATIKDAYIRDRQALGSPVAGWNGSCVSFVRGKLCYDPFKPVGWQVEWQNLGLERMLLLGLTPRPGSEVHPAARDYLQTRREQGEDTGRTIGRVLSGAVPDPQTGDCRAFTDKTVLVFPCIATSGDQVERAPLGLESLPPPPPPVATAVIQGAPVRQPETPAPPLLGIVSLLVLVVIIGLFLWRGVPGAPTTSHRTS